MKRTFLIYSMICAFSLACKKNSGDSATTSKTELITQASWKYESASIDQNKDGVADFPISQSYIPACALDNLLTLSSNGSGIVNEGTILCSGAPQSIPITWSFANNETALVLGGAGIFGASGQFKILQLTPAKLSLSKDTAISAVGNVAIILNMQH